MIKQRHKSRKYIKGEKDEYWKKKKKKKMMMKKKN